MADERRGQFTPETELAGQEFLEAQKIKAPATIEELVEATDQAFASVETRLGKTDSFEQWVDVTDDLEDAFFETADGALGKRLMELVALSDDEFETHRSEAEQLIKQTATASLRLYPIIHRLQTTGFAPTREEVVRKISSGELIEQVKVDNVSITPVRDSLIGLLRDLDDRLGTNVWSLEYPPELPTSVVVTDPFDAQSPELAKHYRQAIEAKHKIAPEQSPTILSLSQDKTVAVAYELENIAEQTEDEDLKSATKTVVEFLNKKAIYYQDPDPRDFEMYHLGLEQPEDLMNLFQALDRIKHADPELFLELVGINPEDGGRSPYFGSFLHKAIYNTQKVVSKAGPELGELAIKTMLDQLLTLDAHVKTYAGVVSQESLKAMAGEIRKSVEASPTPQSKAQALMMMAVPFTTLAIDAEVKRQLEALREVNIETVKADFDRHLNDIEHPLKFIEFLKGVPRSAFDDPKIKRETRQALGIESEWLETHVLFYPWVKSVLEQNPSDFIRPLYARIPLIDETREDLGFGLRIRIVIRDAVQSTNFREKIAIAVMGPEIQGKQLLHSVLGENVLFQEDYEAIADKLTTLERQFGRRLAGDSRKNALTVVRNRYDPDYKGPKDLLPESKEDWPFYLAGMFIDLSGELNSAFLRTSMYDLWKLTAENSPDLVFLTIIANPKGTEVALANFNKFCDLIPPERMLAILEDNFGGDEHPAVRKFIDEFWIRPHLMPEVAKPWTEHQMRAILESRRNEIEPEILISMYKDLNEALVSKRTPWTLGLEDNLIDLWSLTKYGEITDDAMHITPVEDILKRRTYLYNLDLTDVVKLDISTLLVQGFKDPHLRRVGDHVVLSFDTKSKNPDWIAPPRAPRGEVTIKIKPTETVE